MHTSPQVLNVLRGAQRPPPGGPLPLRPSLLIAGATGILGNEVVRILAGSTRFGAVHVLAREPVRTGIARVSLAVCTGDVVSDWPSLPADVAVVMFEPPRLFYQRERALWVPRADQVAALAHWLHGCGVHTLVVVMPHAQGQMPAGLQPGFANLTEQSVSALGFERVIWVRNAEHSTTRARAWTHRVRDLLLSVFGYMVPPSQRPVRATQVAQVVAHCLRLAPAGVHVIGAEQLWLASRGDIAKTLTGWFRPSPPT
jgi:hypothetical protein